MTQTVIVLSDMHVGHRLAVAPPIFKDAKGGTYRANKVQRALFDAWCKTAAAWNAPDVLVINGEPIDGQGAKGRGTEQWTTNYYDQINAAVALTRAFHAKKIFLTQGSGYHVEQGGVSIEETFGERVGAEKVKGQFVNPEIYLTVENVHFNFAHAIGSSISGWNYRSTAIAKEMMLGQLMKSHKYPFDVLVRSHVHYFWAVESAGKLGVITPAWQLQTSFMQRNGTMGTIPDLGAIRFTVSGSEYYLEKKLYRLDETRPPRVRV